MTPINEFVVKIASRCNLNCDYCYEYNGGDTSWRQMPSTMSYELATALAARIREHAETYALSHVHIGLHGGEPLVVPLQRLERLVRLFRSLEAPSRSIGISLQTNATLLRREHAELFRETDVEVSVSIDGDRSANDRHRHDHSGRSSFLALLAGIRTMQQFAPNNLVGLLAVVDVANNPSDTLDFLGSFEVSQVDFLLPHYHWDRLPPRPPRPMDGDVAYGRWMLDVYRAWAGGRQTHLRIRFLEHAIRRLVGAPGLFEQMSIEPVTLAVVNTAGSYEAVDSLKSTGSGAQHLHLSVLRDTLDAVATHPMIAIRQSGEDQLSQDCRACRLVDTCAGGYFPHRFGRQRGFDNPSVYCADLRWFYDHLLADLKLRPA